LFFFGRGQNVSSTIEPHIVADHVDALDRALTKHNLSYDSFIDDLENSILHLAVNKGKFKINQIFFFFFVSYETMFEREKNNNFMNNNFNF
jgi:hypothetical protein